MILSGNLKFSTIIEERLRQYSSWYRISKIRIFPQNQLCIVFLQTKEKLPNDDLILIEREINNLLNIGNIKIQHCIVNYSINEYLESNWGNILNLIYKKTPSINSWLNNLKWEIRENTLVIKLSDQIGVEILNNKNVPNQIRDILYNETGNEVVVTLEKSSDLDECHDDYYTRKIYKEKQLVEDILKQNNLSLCDDKKKQIFSDSSIILGKEIKEEPIKLDEIKEEGQEVVIQGRIFDVQSRHIKNNNILIFFSITDFTGSIYIKTFAKATNNTSSLSGLREGIWLKIKGQVEYDNFLKDLIVNPTDINVVNFNIRTDSNPEKRVELHLHTNMSAMDGINPPEAYIKRAAEWGHPAIAITDHGVVQAFPDAYSYGRNYGIKIIFGVEAYIMDDEIEIIKNPKDIDIAAETFVVFDIETTGLSPSEDEITEIGAVKIKNGKVIGEFHTLVNPGKPIPVDITKLTGITDEMVKDAPGINTVLAEFLEFVGDSTIVAHNAQFDMGFIYNKCEERDIVIKNPVLDSLYLSRVLLKELKNHKLNTIANHLNVRLDNHHRAVDDAKATGEIFWELVKRLMERGIKNLTEINELTGELGSQRLKTYHALILAKNQRGLKNLYKLISLSHLNYFYRNPRIPKKELVALKEGLIIGSGCQAGEIYQGILNGLNPEELKRKCKFYDFLEVQPIMNNYFLVNKGLVSDTEKLKSINKQIYDLGKSLNIPVVATGDVHFLEPEDEVFRRVLMASQGYEDADNHLPLYFKTTDEMLNEFEYLGREAAREIVIRNPRAISDSIEDIKPLPDELFTPKIDGAEQTITEMTYNKAKEIYGDPLPDIVEKRLKKELDSIVNNGFAVIYLISHKLVKRSLDDGYLVGSRGSVGSSLVATMCDITEVNPLPPHYVCQRCKYSEFHLDEKYGTGPDLPDKNCPRCGEELRKDGYNIPFEVFMGFEGDKVPDIDLNFSGEYQPIAHKYAEELFGEKYVYRAGTIGTIAERTAYGFIKGFMEEKKIVLHKAEIDRLVKGCTGIKRTTGQHPGGLMVVPKDMDIHDFTPIQYPADDRNSNVITTHFDYHAISSRLLKLDILGHDDPTVLKMLQDITGVDPKKIPLDDKKTMKIFSGIEPLNLKTNDLNISIGTIGVPEFGTKFVRQMLEETKPTTFSELIRISGLSHGTDVWLNNAQDLIKNKIATLSQVISTRDDIMTHLIHKGLPPNKAFKVMEKVRKGKGLDKEDEELMKSKGVPDWFIGSCKKIKYMFPKAHAVAYVIMAFRIAYFKVYFPKAFYATYFSVKADDFDADIILKGPRYIKNRIEEIEAKGNNMTQKEKNLLTILEVAWEMYSRGLTFLPVDLYKSDAERFIIIKDGLILPFNSLQGVGKMAAHNIVKCRENGKFISVEDLRRRAKLTKTAIDVLRRHGCLEGLSETNQLNFLSLA